MIDFTHDAHAKSWLVSAQAKGSDFPIQNLPFGVCSPMNPPSSPRGGVAIGDQIVDLARLAATELLTGTAREACIAASQKHLNDFMSLGQTAWRALRHSLFNLLRDDVSTSVQEQMRGLLIPQANAVMHMPVNIGAFTDFFTSLHHAVNGGRIARPGAPLIANFKWLPAAYNGRASSVVLSGTAFHRPKGQARPSGLAEPVFGPSTRLDFELELGFFVGEPSRFGHGVPVAQARNHIFGMCLLNDWSARDIQFWEMDPLGPFLGKSFCTSISPWIITMDALEPYRTPLIREAGDPASFDYLDDEMERDAGAYDIRCDVLLQSAEHREHGFPGDRVTSTSFKYQYWSVSQMLAHHTVNGCNVRTGDLMGTGTISGPTRQQTGSLLELTEGGALPVSLPSTMATRTFLEDGDAVELRGYCVKEGAARIGFGTCYGMLLPATI